MLKINLDKERLLLKEVNETIEITVSDSEHTELNPDEFTWEVGYKSETGSKTSVISLDHKGVGRLIFDDEERLLKDELYPNIVEIVNKDVQNKNRILYKFTAKDQELCIDFFFKRRSLITNEEVEVVRTIPGYSGIKFFEYAFTDSTSPEDHNPPEESQLIVTEDVEAAKVFDPGYYNFYIRAVDFIGNKGPFYHENFYVAKPTEDIKMHKGISTPTGVKSNHRYRGPAESRKNRDLYNQAVSNIKILKKRLEDIEKSHEGLMSKGIRVDSKTTLISDSIDNIFDNIKKYKEV